MAASVVPQRECGVERLEALGSRLLDQECVFAKRYRCLFALMNVKPSVHTRRPLMEALREQKHGALLRHEVAYVLGQMQDSDEEVVDLLVKVLRDKSDDVMVRHEAAEALGAIGNESCKGILQTHLEDECREVAETCELALRRISDLEAEKVERAENGSSKFNTVDPTVVSKSVQNLGAAALEALALDESASMHDRYEAIFAIRNRGGKEAVDLMTKCLAQSQSTLLKHEVALFWDSCRTPKPPRCSSRS